MNQITLAVACAPRYTTVQRLARWLLASCKLLEADTLSSTQYALATMLGVSRGQLNRAASELQRRGVVQVGRGGLTMLNATGLREIARSCDAGACHDPLNNDIHALQSAKMNVAGPDMLLDAVHSRTTDT